MQVITAPNAPTDMTAIRVIKAMNAHTATITLDTIPEIYRANFASTAQQIGTGK